MTDPAHQPRPAAAAPPLIPSGGNTHRDDLIHRSLFTLGALLVYLLGMRIPLPGCNLEAFSPFGPFSGLDFLFANNQIPVVPIFAFGVMPYIWAMVSIHLLSLASERLRALKNGDTAQRRQFNSYTRNLSLMIAGYQAYAIAIDLESRNSAAGPVVFEPGYLFQISTVATLTAGTMFLIWLGDEITRRGVGKGISLLVFASLLPTVSLAIPELAVLARLGAISTIVLLGTLMLLVALVAAIVTLERAHRRILVVRPMRAEHAPAQIEATDAIRLKLNAAGIIAPVIALGLATLLTSLALSIHYEVWMWSFAFRNDVVSAKLLVSQFLTVMVLTLFASYMARSVRHDPEALAHELKAEHAFLPGLQPGHTTARHIDRSLARLAPLGGLWLAGMCVLPDFILPQLGLPFAIGGFSLLLMTLAALEFLDDLRKRIVALDD